MKNISATVAELIRPTVEENGCLLWDVEYVKEGARQILRVTIDKEGETLTIDDCERVHRAIDPILDEADPIDTAYYLEVSSPGVERTLREPWHIKQYIGSQVDVKLYSAIDGEKNFTGVLESFDEDSKTLTVGNKTFTIDKAAKINVHFTFDN